MGKSANTTPATDPVAASRAQTQSAMQTAAYDAQLNRYNQNTPYGAVTWNNAGTTDNPQWSQTTSLSPAQQAILGSQQTAQLGQANLGNTLLNNSALSLSNPITASGTLQTSVNGGNLDAARQQAQNAVYGQQKALLDPQYDQQKKQLDAQLAAQGITAGSEAYNNAENNFARQRDYAYNQAANSAITSGNDLANQQFNQGLSGAQLNNNAVTSGLNNALALRSGNLNSIQALLGGAQVNNPQAVQGGQINTANTDVASNFYASQQQQQANANAKNAAANANTQAGASLASAALLALMLA